MDEMIKGTLRTHHCNELHQEHEEDEVILCGWVNKYRNLGGLHFVDIRDKYGMTQLAFEEYQGSEDDLKELSLESVIMAKGIVKSRPEEAINKNMATGEIEVQVRELKLLSLADKDKIPFLPYGATEPTEDLALKYRYLALRSRRLQDILSLRSRTTMKVRQALMNLGFIEVETPILYKSTPEGARDFIVPSRIHHNSVYALPQSPQILKQLLMIGNTDKYFQIARCFRDEDLRTDRQPEFTQIDIEASFITTEYIKHLCEQLLQGVFSLSDDFTLASITYQEAMVLYGTDKPDVSFGLKQIDVTKLFAQSDFATFSKVASSGGLIKAMYVPETLGSLSRKVIDQFPAVVKPYGGKGVAWFKDTDGKASGGISKFISESIQEELSKLVEENSTKGTWLFVADGDHAAAHASSDALRRHLGDILNLREAGYHFLWIDNFPLLEWSEEDGRFVAVHHPFTAPIDEDFEKFNSGDKDALLQCRANAYDVVCNGFEIGGGSIRIFQKDVQKKMFEVLGMSEEEAYAQFGFFIDALNFGTPPHGGVAFGLDRIIMILADTKSIRDVIAFPKTTSASDLMAGAPSAPQEFQLEELNFSWKKQ